MSNVTLKGVFKSYLRADNSRCDVLRDFNLSVTRPEIVSLVGPNGAGKSSVMHLIAKLTRPERGSVSVRTELKSEAQVGYVWQNYRASLLPWLTAIENVAFGLRLQGHCKDKRRKTANDLLKRFAPRISPTQRCYELSGGQQQMISILRSVACLPDVLLLDEPTSALDASSRWNIVRHLEEIWTSRPLPVIYVCHDIDEAVLTADRIALLSRRTGRLAGIVDNHCERPRSASMLASAEHIRCRREVLEFLLDEGDFGNDDEKD